MLHTHASVVFLAGDRAYKIKKPVDLGFMDFTTLEKRRANCEAEVVLNRRLAPSVYLGVVPVVDHDGAVRVGGGGTALEYAVRMERLPEEATLRSRVRRGELGPETLELVARRLAAFHERAATGEEIARWGRFEVVAGNARENFEQTEAFQGSTVSAEVWERLRDVTEAELARRRELIEERARPGVTRDTHGDLHLDHVYHFPDRDPPRDLVIVDCLEFSDRFRFADPVSDAAFLAMDLRFHGRADLARAFADAYFAAPSEPADEAGRALLPHYTAYRSVVRAKVESLETAEEEVPEDQRREVLQRARGHFLLALGVLAPPAERPCLVATAGLPGTGKSRLARGLEERAGFVRIASDAVRKELAGLAPDEPAAAAVDRGIYTPEHTERTYEACLEQAGEALFEGRRVVLDAGYREEARRREGMEAARGWGVEGRGLVCEAPPEEVRRRLDERAAAPGADPSDADWEVYRALVGRWEEPSPGTEAAVHRIDTSGEPEQTLERALEVLRTTDLL